MFLLRLNGTKQYTTTTGAAKTVRRVAAMPTTFKESIAKQIKDANSKIDAQCAFFIARTNETDIRKMSNSVKEFKRQWNKVEAMAKRLNIKIAN